MIDQKAFAEYLNRMAKEFPEKYPDVWRELNTSPIEGWLTMMRAKTFTCKMLGFGRSKKIRRRK